MTNRATMLPALMVVVIVLLAIIAMASGRSNEPDVTADAAYPHYICTMNSYCEGENCTRDAAISFVAYLSHEDGKPRLEFPRMSNRAVISEVPDGLAFDSTGGEVEGRVSIFSDGGMDFVATSGEGSEVVEHFASGRCERLRNP